MYKKVFSAAILASAAMAMTSCSTSKNTQNENATKAEKITEAEAARPSADEEMDEGYLVLSEAQQNIVKKNNDFAFRLYQQISGMDSEVVSPMSIAYLMGMLANGADGKEPSAKQLTAVIRQAREDGVRRIFYQNQFPASTVEIIARDIDAEYVEIDPLDEDAIGAIDAMTDSITAK